LGWVHRKQKEVKNMKGGEKDLERRKNKLMDERN
jgi:hypothetical protein